MYIRFFLIFKMTVSSVYCMDSSIEPYAFNPDSVACNSNKTDESYQAKLCEYDYVLVARKKIKTGTIRYCEIQRMALVNIPHLKNKPELFNALKLAYDNLQKTKALTEKDEENHCLK